MKTTLLLSYIALSGLAAHAGTLIMGGYPNKIAYSASRTLTSTPASSISHLSVRHPSR